MNYLCKCTKCGATWWHVGTHDYDTNATELSETTLPEETCSCDPEDFEIIDQEPADEYD